MDKRQIVQAFLNRGIQIDPSILEEVEKKDLERIDEYGFERSKIDEDALHVLRVKKNPQSMKQQNSDRMRTSVEIVKSFKGHMDSKDVDEFVTYFCDRYDRMKEFLRERVELSNLMSIGRLDTRGQREDVAVIGLVSDMYQTSSGRYMVYVEDPTGKTKVLLDEDQGDWIVEDEILGIAGVTGDDIIFANNVVRPDIPLSRDITTTSEEVYAAFISDLHIGSFDTLDDQIEDLAQWLRSDEGVAANVGYLIVNGDMVEGVGNYPGQKEELRETDIKKQYKEFTEFVEKIPKSIQVIVVPGNHDYVRLAEPQPPLPKDIVPDLYAMDNVHMVSNPATVNIHTHDNGGITVLCYHGFSFDNHVDTIQKLRERGYEEPHHAMVDYLRRRHVAPTYGSNLLSPEARDYMVIDEIPDIFTMGHTHAFDVANYKGINLISSGTMQKQTAFQERVGHSPDPGKVALVNLKTRDVKVREFLPEGGLDE